MITWFNSRKVGGKLESRVIKWFDYLWANKNSMDEEMVLSMLPEKLKVRFRVSNRNSVATVLELPGVSRLTIKIHLRRKL